MTETSSPNASTSVGVSVVICCHNSASRLPQTLAHLAAQVTPPGLPWEVIVVDNASTDGTADLAQTLWNVDNSAPLRVVQEPALGLSHARRRGFSAARYEFVSFIDDDNWVCPNWTSLVAEILIAHPDVGACGGFNEPEYETVPPTWFERFHGYLAIGPQSNAAGDVTDTRGWLFGAGLSVRKSAWKNLIANGFRFSIGDRTGTSLIGGGDCELCFGLVLSGWRLWYDPRLHLKHFMPSNRLTWQYIRRLGRAIGQTEPWLDVYRELVTGHRVSRSWSIVHSLAILARHPIKLVLSKFFSMEGDRHVAVQDLFVGRLTAQLWHGKKINLHHAELREASWVRLARCTHSRSQTSTHNRVA